jgi:hypothetical protein
VGTSASTVKSAEMPNLTRTVIVSYPVEPTAPECYTFTLDLQNWYPQAAVKMKSA